MNLLSKIRKINSILQMPNTNDYFKVISETLCEIIKANVFIVNAAGKLLGYSFFQQIENTRMDKIIENRQFPNEYMIHLSHIHESNMNLDIESEYTIFPVENKDLFKKGLTAIVPIIGGEERLGTLILSRMDQAFDYDDLLLNEYSATVIGIELIREKSVKLAENSRKITMAQMAINSLSYSELDALKYIFEELNGVEGLLVTSKIADRFGITRSVIVNGLRKLESAGIVDAQSLGMKGTFIKILNDQFLFELSNVIFPEHILEKRGYAPLF